MMACEIYAFSMGYNYGTSLGLLLVKKKIDTQLYIFIDPQRIFNNVTGGKRLSKLK